MRHVNGNARIIALLALAVGILLLPAEFAEAQLPTAPYQVIDLFPMSAGSSSLYYPDLDPIYNGSIDYHQAAAGGEFVVNDQPAPGITGSGYLWNGNGNLTVLNPTGTGFPHAYVTATDGAQQVGAAWNGTSGGATLWSGTAASAVNLNPSQLGATGSIALGVKNGQQVGHSGITGNTNDIATVWNGSAASAVLLTPPSGYISTDAIATDGVHQVGYAGWQAGDPHAVMWSGSANSMVDLDPGLGLSKAITVAGDQEGGFALDSNGRAHAALWTGSAQSFVDLTPQALAALNPLLIYHSSVTSTNGVQQVGFFGMQNSVGGSPLIWSGTAGSAELLPTFGSDIFTPYDIDNAGNIYGIADDLSTGQLTAVEWVPTPEPGSIALFTCGVAGLLLRRRRRSK